MEQAITLTIVYLLQRVGPVGHGLLVMGGLYWNGSSSLVSNFDTMAALMLIGGLVDVLALIMAWWITFTIVLTLLLCLGFGPVGIVPGTLRAKLQKSLIIC